MKALITGASSGIGKDMAIYLSQLGHDLIVVARNEIELEKLKNEVKTNCEVIVMDLSIIENAIKLSKIAIKEKVDILINNAGFGMYGNFENMDLEKEMDMIDLNIKSLHVLTKNILSYFKGRDFGYLLNVASSASFLPGGPLLSTYYATKSYVRSYTLGLYEEVRRTNKNVHISVLCPGPVNTNFNRVAGTSFNLKSLESEYVSKYAIDKMFKNKLVIVPGFKIKLGSFFRRFISDKLLLKFTYVTQKKKGN